MLKIPFLACLLAVTSLFATVSKHGALRVENGQVVNKDGVPPQLRGMSLFWNQWQEGSQFYNAATVSTLANSWKANIVRAAIGNGSTADAKTMIDAAIANDMYVIVDWHKHNIDAAGAKTFFQDISTYVKGKGNPANVIYEIFNEPREQDNGTWANVKTYANEVIPVIRANSPENLIIVGTPMWSSRVDVAAADPITGTNAKNLAYAFHFYASEHGNSHRNYVNSAVCKNLPVFVTEWGTPNADGTGTIDWSKVATWVSFMESHKLSHVNWSISSKYESAGETSSTRPDGTLSPSGTYMKDLISKLNQGQSHGDAGPMEFPPCGDQKQEGPVMVGSQDTLQAENFLEHTGPGDKREENVASQKAYLGTLGAGSKTKYGLRSPDNRIVVLNIRYRIPGATVTSNDVKATIKVSDGIHENTYGLPERAGWVYRASIAPVQLSPSTDITVEVISGSVDIDYYTWRPVTDNDKGPNSWPDLANWGSSNQTPIAKNVRLQTENAAKAYYNLKGNPLGNTLPKEQGVYILKQGGVSKMVLVK